MISDQKYVLAKREKSLGGYFLIIVCMIVLDIVFALLSLSYKSIILLGICAFFVALTVIIIYKYSRTMKLSDDLIYIIRDHIVFYDEDNIKRTIKQEDILQINVDIVEITSMMNDNNDLYDKMLNSRADTSVETDWTEMKRIVSTFDNKMKVFTKKGSFTVNNVNNANNVKIKILNHKWTNKG